MLKRLLRELEGWAIHEVKYHGEEIKEGKITHRWEVRTQWRERYFFVYDFEDLVNLKDPEAFMIEAIKTDITAVRREFALRN